MEIVVFENYQWKDIPTQDNPINDASLQQPCIVICLGEIGYDVIMITPQGMGRIGAFKELYYASLFSEAVINEF